MPHPKNDLAGQRFGRLLAVRLGRRGKHRNWTWFCQCDCGVSCEVSRSNLLSGGARSCGCLRRELAAALIKHGHTRVGARSRTYCTWVAMVDRCTNHKRKYWPRYGGRGIRVCRRWRKFENFLADMGERPPARSLDRKNNNGHYTKANCRWATASEQARNKRRKNAALAAA